jgi:serine/threonine-protein kinase
MIVVGGTLVDREERIDRAVIEFEMAADRGEPPDRSTWLARHPGLEDELESYLKSRDAFAPQVGRPTSADEPTRTFVPRAGTGPRPASGVAGETAPGEKVGDYVLLDCLGEGGQGVVWRARPQHAEDIIVALKMLRPWAEQDSESVGRLHEDAKAIARMRHPNIIKVHFFGQDRGRWYFAMELMEGGTVARRLDRYRDDPRSAAVLMEKVARAIHHAHTRNPGVLHLDLKPGNILLDSEGEPRVTDFGLSARMESLGAILGTPADEVPGERPSAPAASPGEISVAMSTAGMVGTIPYMSPEMARGRTTEISTACDVYGLGAILYAMLTGQPPCKGRDDIETLEMVSAGRIVPPRSLNRKVDRELDALCMKCLRTEPEARYASANGLAEDLGRWLRREPTLARGQTAGRHIRFWLRRHPVWVVAGCMVLVLAWLALTAGSLLELAAVNRREAARLARDADAKLGMIERALIRSARDPALLRALRGRDAPPGTPRRSLDEFLDETTRQYNHQFDLTDTHPLFNVYLQDVNGILLADSNDVNKKWLGRDFSRRDYFQGVLRLGHDGVHVSRAYHSVKDGHYKIAVSTRVWDGDRCLGVLAANVALGPSLVDLNMKEEPGGAMLVSPMDWTYDELERGRSRLRLPYIVALTAEYEDTTLEPIFLDDRRVPLMSRFAADLDLEEAVDHVTGGALSHYHRVGRTSLVLVVRQPYPRLLRLFLSWRVLVLLTLVLVPPLAFYWRRRVGREAVPAHGVTPSPKYTPI